MILLEDAGKNLHRSLKLLRDHLIGAQGIETVNLCHITGTDNNVEVMSQSTHLRDHMGGGDRIRDGYDQNTCPPDAHFLKDSRTGPVAKSNGFAGSPGLIHQIRVHL